MMNETTHLFRRAAAALIGVIAIVLWPALALADGPLLGGWFGYDEEVNRAWTVAAVGDDRMRVSIKPRFNAAPPYRVTVLYPRQSSAYDIAITKILQVFVEKDIEAEFMVVNFDNDQARGSAALRQAEADKANLIFAMGSESTAWLFQNYRGGSIPVVSVCSKDPVELGQATAYDTGTGTNFAFTSLNMPIDVQMTYIREVKPNLRNFAILADGTNVSAMQTQTIPMGRLGRKMGMRVLDVIVKNPAQAREELAKMVAEAVKIMRATDPTLANSIFWITGSTAVFREIDTINASADRVAVISAVPEVVQRGDSSAALSIGISFESNAHLAAVYGAEVLTGRVAVGDLKVGIVSPPDIAINFRRVRQIGLQMPFSFFESASYLYDYQGKVIRNGARAPSGS